MDADIGKKIYFLYPHSVIQDEVVYEIVKNEYEAYLVRDHKKIVNELRENPDSILYVNIDDDNMTEPEWEKYVKNIMSDNTLQVRIGIMTYNNNQELAQKYLMELGVQCGFIVLKIGSDSSRRIILRTLEANEAKGKRKFVRAQCVPGTAHFNIKYDGSQVNGEINDISSVGMSCSFSKSIDPPKGAFFKAVQLILKGKIVMVDAVIMGKREMEEGGVLYVMLFGKNIQPIEKSKIHRFIYEALQQVLNNRLAI